MTDRILGGIGLVLSLFFIWAATLIQESFISDQIGPKTFPIIIGGVMAVASLFFIFRPDPEPKWPSLNRLAEIGFAIVVTFLYALVLPDLGFLISTTLAAGYLTWRLGSTPLQSVVIGVSTSVGIYIVFRLILGLSLAEGPFGF